MTNPTDKLGHEIEIGDLVAVPVLIQGSPVLEVGVVSEADVVGGKGVLVVEGVSVQKRLQWTADWSASNVTPTPRSSSSCRSARPSMRRTPMTSGRMASR